MSVLALKDTLISLITAGYVSRAPTIISGSEDSPVPIFENNVNKNTLPEIDVRLLMQTIKEDSSNDINDGSVSFYLNRILKI
jgi:hypothetical protein